MARPRKKIVSPKRSRGGQPGNTHRLVHGRYTQPRREHHAIARRLVRTGHALVMFVTILRD